VKKGNNGCFELIDRPAWSGRGLEFSLAVDQENRRIAGDIPIQIGDLASRTHRDFLDMFPL